MAEPWVRREGNRGLGHYIERSTEPVLASGLPRRFRQPCRYRAYVPDHLAGVDLALPERIMTDVSDAERAIQQLNSDPPKLTSLEAVARFLLRAEAVASSRIEGLTLNARRLVEAEAARALGAPLRDATAEAVMVSDFANRLRTRRVRTSNCRRASGSAGSPFSAI